MIETPRGIEGLDTSRRPPIGAVVTMGKKGPSGNPVMTDRWFVMGPITDGVGKAAHRNPHPSFGAFNADSLPDDPPAVKAMRTTIRGVLVHAKEVDCFTYRRQANKLPGILHPRSGPICMGNGCTATRYNVAAKAYLEIPCPGDKCQFAIADGPGKPPCGAHAKLLFQMRWEKSPNLMASFATGGWHSMTSMVEFFRMIESQAKQMGLTDYSLWGLPFSMTIGKKSNPEQGRSYPVISISTDFPAPQPGQQPMTVQSFLMQQLQSRRDLLGMQLAIGAPTIAETSDDETLAADVAAITPGRVP